MLLERLFNNSFLRSGFFYSVVSFGASFLAYILNLIIARSFSLSDYGEYMSAIAYLTLFSIPLGALGMMVIRKIGSVDPDKRVGLARTIEKWLVHELTSLIPIILFLSIGIGLLMFYKGQMSLPAIFFIILSTIAGIFFNFYTAVLQSYKKFDWAGGFAFASVLIKMVLTIIAIYFFSTLQWLFGSFLIATILITIIGHWLISAWAKKEKNEIRLNDDIQFKKFFFYLGKKSVLIPLISIFCVISLSNIDVVLVKKFFVAEEAGLYSSLSLLGKIILYITTPLSAVAYTYFTGSDSRDQSRKVLFAVTGLISLIGFSAALGYGLFPNLVIKIIFGDKFLSVTQLVWLSAVFGALYSLVNLYIQYFAAKNSMYTYLGIIATIAQVLGIYYNHQSLSQILWVNIIVNASLVVTYFLIVAKKEFRTRILPVNLQNL